MGYPMSATAESLYARFLEALGHDLGKEGLSETPRRHAAFLAEVTTKPEFKFTTFSAEGYDQMIVQTGIPFYSLCEHHVVPFFGEAIVAYIPAQRIVGLSKLARTVEFAARGLQNQERITETIADILEENLAPLGVAVSIKARHLCMEMRGVKKPGAETRTTSLRGQFKDDAVCRNEFMSYLR
jgi:GTP cyclohydrolase I